MNKKAVTTQITTRGYRKFTLRFNFDNSRRW